MALIELDFRSRALGYHEEAVIILPDRPATEKYPVLWLFHGANQDCTEWLRLTSIERFAAKRGLAIVMPTVSNGHGMDMLHGMKYFTMLSEELPAAVHYMLPCLSKEREKNFTAGASMGGYVAYKLALNYPDRYCAAGAFAGALDIVGILSGNTHRPPSRGPIEKDGFFTAFGTDENICETNSDIIWLCSNLVKEGKAPRLWSLVGNGDFGFSQVKGACEKFKAAGADISEFYDEGIHSFDLWDKYIEPFFDWLGLAKEEK